MVSEREMRLVQLLRTESDETLRVWLAVGQQMAGDAALSIRCRMLAQDQIAACEALLAARRADAACARRHVRHAPKVHVHGSPRAVIAMEPASPLLDVERV